VRQSALGVDAGDEEHGDAEHDQSSKYRENERGDDAACDDGGRSRTVSR